MSSAMLEHSTVRLYVAYWTISMAEADPGVWSSSLRCSAVTAYLSVCCCYDWVHVLNQFTKCFTENFTDILTHAQTVCTKPFLLHKVPGDEARCTIYLSKMYKFNVYFTAHPTTLSLYLHLCLTPQECLLWISHHLRNFVMAGFMLVMVVTHNTSDTLKCRVFLAPLPFPDSIPRPLGLSINTSPPQTPPFHESVCSQVT